MKHFLHTLVTISLLSLVSANDVRAQVVDKGSHHLYLGVGFPNIPAYVVTKLGSGNNGRSFGPVAGTYEYGILRKLGVGVQMGYASGTSRTFTWTDDQQNIEYEWRWHLSVFTIMGRLTYHYLNSREADLYSGISVGYGIASIKAEGVKDPLEASLSAGGLGFNINPIGFRYLFGEHIGAFTELGFGWNGFVTLGASAKF